MKSFFKKKWVKRVISIILVVALVVTGVFVWKHFASKQEVLGTEVTAIVTRRNITNSVTGSASVEAYETYDIVATVSGEILECNAEIGDWVEEDQVLYKFDTESSENKIKDNQNSVEEALLSLESAHEAVENLTIKAPASGMITNLALKKNSDASGKACTITDNTYVTATVPVPTSAVGNIKIGDSVTVGVEKYMISLTGIVEDVLTSSYASKGGSMVTNVEIRVDNPGSMAEGTFGFITVHTSAGDIEGAEAVALNYPDPIDVKIEQSGTVKTVYVKNTDWVNEGDVIAVLENSDVNTRLRSAEITYEKRLTELSDAKKELEEYILTSPIAGEVLAKEDYKAGEKVTAGQNGGTTLMTIADTTKMKFTINIDELDVSKISVGQNVSITTDAIENARFTGVIETVSMLGTSSNGVTVYPVVVRIDNPPEALLPGMNVNAEIVVESVQNVIAVPADAVSYYDGAYYVTVIGEAVGIEDTGETAGGMTQGRPMDGEMPTGGMPEGEMPEGEMPTGDMSQRSNRGGQSGNRAGGNKSMNNGANTQAEIEQKLYDEPIQVQVKTGISDDDYIEITEGLEVGQIISYIISSSESSQMGMMGGGMMGGGMPGGGGGMPGGGGMGGRPGGR
ncbi:MAG: HlyD family efflux transporter periplasmic adaptor subunit [Clostridia bacterium]|nr:HlyD family efflux transporter periplasmic adaptor subunit [Clostridia bacterium]